jgi:hypothetical protein
MALFVEGSFGIIRRMPHANLYNIQPLLTISAYSLLKMKLALILLIGFTLETK